MKILYHHRIASKDGQYVHVEELTKALKKLGHEIIMVCPDVTKNSDFGSEGGLVPLMKRFIPGFIYELLELAYAFFAYLKLSRAVKHHQPNCLYERYNLYSPAGVWIKWRYKLPMLLEVNAPIFDERSKYNGIAIPWLARWSERYTWTGADRVLPVTQVLANYVKDAGVDESRIIVIPNGIDPEKFENVPDIIEAKKRLGLEGCQVMGFTGFVREWHGLERVLDLLKDQQGGQGRHLLVVGDGPARGDIEKRAAQLNVSDKVTFTGIVPRDQVIDLVAAFDVALQPDVVAYASPLKLFEYMALGKAIVAPNTPNIREILINNKNALLFDLDDEASFLKCVAISLSDQDLQQSLGLSAKKTITERKLTWINNARIVEALVKDMPNSTECSQNHNIDLR